MADFVTSYQSDFYDSNQDSTFINTHAKNWNTVLMENMKELERNLKFSQVLSQLLFGKTSLSQSSSSYDLGKYDSNDKCTKK